MSKEEILKIGDTQEFCVSKPKQPSQVLFGIIRDINKDNQTVVFQRVQNNGWKSGKRDLRLLDEFYNVHYGYIRLVGN